MGNWFTDQREAWVLEMVQIYGFIRRRHLMDKFGISLPQASRDLNAVLRKHPSVMTYNKSTKQYEVLSTAPYPLARR